MHPVDAAWDLSLRLAKLTLVAVLLPALLSMAAYGQTSSASITGVVRDATG